MRISDWSSDVCSSDLAEFVALDPVRPGVRHRQHPPRRIIKLEVGEHAVPVGDCVIRVARRMIAVLFIVFRRFLAGLCAALDQVLAAAEIEHRHPQLREAEMVGPIIEALFGGRFVDHRPLRRRRDLGDIGVEFGLAAAHNNDVLCRTARVERSEEHTSELQSLMRNSYAVFCLNKKKQTHVNVPEHSTMSTLERVSLPTTPTKEIKYVNTKVTNTSTDILIK